MPISLREAYDLVSDLIPDYQWTTIMKGGDLIHIPTKTTLSYDIDGYYLSLFTGTIPMYDYEVGDFVKHTQDPRIAVHAFVQEVLSLIMQERLENK